MCRRSTPAEVAAGSWNDLRVLDNRMKAKIRKLVIFVEETRSEMGKAIEPPTRRAAAVAVIENPFAGRYVEDLSELMRYRRGTG